MEIGFEMVGAVFSVGKVYPIRHVKWPVWNFSAREGYWGVRKLLELFVIPEHGWNLLTKSCRGYLLHPVIQTLYTL